MAVTAKSLIRRDQSPSPREEDELSSTPIRQRRSLSPSERQGTRKQSSLTHNYQQPAQADVLEEEEQEQHMDVTTEDLVEDDAPITRSSQSAKVTPLRARHTSISVQSEPKGIPWVKIIVVLAVIAIVVWGLVRTILAVIDFGTDVSNTYHYGPNRTTVVSGVFGHDDSLSNPTQIIALNLQGTLLIEAMSGGDVSKVKTFPTGLVLVGDSAAKTPIILTIKDVNDDHKPDVLIEIPGQGVTMRLINTGTDFLLKK